jgi:RNA polymerase sigma factor (sigma-70 family)
MVGVGPDEGSDRSDRTPLPDLVRAANVGDKDAWDELVDRFSTLIVSICRRLRLNDTDTRDISQIVWLRVVEQLPGLRDAAALPGWLSTTTRNECLRHLRTSARARRSPFPSDGPAADVPGEADIVDALLQAQRRHGLRQAYADLPEHDQRLLEMLTADPVVPYAEISRRLGIPVGGIGPTRSRLLDKLRRSPHLAALLRPETTSFGEDQPVRRSSRRGPHDAH